MKKVEQGLGQRGRFRSRKPWEHVRQDWEGPCPLPQGMVAQLDNSEHDDLTGSELFIVFLKTCILTKNSLTMLSYKQLWERSL